MTKLQRIKEPIKDEMDQFEVYFKKTMKSNVPLLNIITNYILRRKGKMMRPMFVFLTAKLNGSVTEKTYVAASLVELLHTATLIHDDVVDDANYRRGFFSVNAIWKSKIAVLMGDFLFSKGMILSIKNNSYELLEIVSDAVKKMAEGELMQIQNTRKLAISEKKYFDIISKKTASLIASCSACGAKSVNSSDEYVQKMMDFGLNVGIAFQVRDDILDYESVSITGKPTGNDIKEKKLTLPLIHILHSLPPGDKRHLIKKIRNHKNKSENIKEIIELVKSKGGLEYAKTKMEHYKNEALRILDDYKDSIYKQSLIDLVEFTVSRKK